ncbi:MAG: Crp/Fnr family transcriptional regulator [Clostridiales bacterium]|nr:Crp/Fnr family transcriptional regulator [Clostridiales bacterium]
MSDSQNTHCSSTDFMDCFLTLSRGSKRLEALGQTEFLKKGTVLVRSGETPEFCYIVRTGRVICYEFSYNGEQRVYNFMEPGSLLLEEFLLFDRPCPIFFATALDSELVKITKQDLTDALRRDFDIVMDVFESISAKHLSAMEYQRVGYHQDAGWQICRFLLLLIEHYGEKENGRIQITEKFSHQMIADFLGMNRVTVSRKLKELRSLGLIDSEKGKLSVPDVNALKKHMDSIQGFQKELPS